MITSTFGSVNHATAPPLEMHPEDAKARGLATGTRVRVWNDLGEVHLPLRVTDVIPRGVVCSLKGAWLRTSDNGQPPGSRRAVPVLDWPRWHR